MTWTRTVGVLPWQQIDYRLRASRTVWLPTTRPDGRPHAAPVGSSGTDTVRHLHHRAPDPERTQPPPLEPGRAAPRRRGGWEDGGVTAAGGAVVSTGHRGDAVGVPPPSPGSPPPDYDELVAASLAAPVHGWDFGWLAGRALGSDPTWSYPRLAPGALDRSTRLLDVDTGGGELLASLTPLPPHTVATEPPGRPRTARPLGVGVLPAPPDAPLPVPDGAFDLLLSRTGASPPPRSTGSSPRAGPC